LLLGSGAALHLGAITLPPLRALLGLPGRVSPLELGGFAVGLALPTAFAWLRQDDVIVRQGATAIRSTAVARRATAQHRSAATRTRIARRARSA
jgi:hypothetical protein